MAVSRAQRVMSETQPGRIAYRQQYIRCGKPNCSRCSPPALGHGPYWYGFYWDYRQRTKSFYVGKQLPKDAEPTDTSGD